MFAYRLLVSQVIHALRVKYKKSAVHYLKIDALTYKTDTLTQHPTPVLAI